MSGTLKQYIDLQLPVIDGGGNFPRNFLAFLTHCWDGHLATLGGAIARPKMLNQIERDKYEKIANLMIVEIPQVQIAAIVGLSESRISQIKDTEEFKIIYGEMAANKVEEGRELNEGWDAIERDAMAIVVDRLQYVKDPDFALKAATLANRAQRRGNRGNQPIPTDLGTRTVLNLSQTFINNIQNNGIDNLKQVESGFNIPLDTMKYNDIQTPSEVEKMLIDVGVVDNKMKELSSEQMDVRDDIKKLFES